MEAYIKRWLHLAGDRDGGRREREGKKWATQHTCKSVAIPILQYMCDTVLIRNQDETVSMCKNMRAKYGTNLSNSK